MNLKKLVTIVKKIFIIITSPIWFPWKILFVRKPEKKYSNVSQKIQFFRILRSPITLPLKFFCFLFIIGLEILTVYKVRYSVLTYPITRNIVHHYYLKNETITNKLIGIEEVSAQELNNNQEKLEQAFKYIDTWNLSEKNKMYAIYNSELMRVFFNSADNKVIEHLLDRFNNQEEYRESIRNLVANTNHLIPRFVKEFTSTEELNEVVEILNSFVSVTTYTIDFNFVLDMFGIYAKLDGGHDFSLFSTDVVDAIYEMAKDYNNGLSLFESIDDGCQKYDCGW